MSRRPALLTVPLQIFGAIIFIALVLPADVSLYDWYWNGKAQIAPEKAETFVEGTYTCVPGLCMDPGTNEFCPEMCMHDNNALFGSDGVGRLFNRAALFLVKAGVPYWNHIMLQEVVRVALAIVLGSIVAAAGADLYRAFSGADDTRPKEAVNGEALQPPK